MTRLYIIMCIPIEVCLMYSGSKDSTHSICCALAAVGQSVEPGSQIKTWDLFSLASPTQVKKACDSCISIIYCEHDSTNVGTLTDGPCLVSASGHSGNP